jgi:uncharacterized protein (TIGR02246 family)
MVALGAGLTLLAPTASAQDDEVVKLANQWTSAYNRHDVAGLAALYTDDAHLYHHGRPRIVGRNGIREFWAADMTENNPITILAVTDTVQGVDMVLVHGNYQVINRESGVPLGGGRFAHIWIQAADGSWRLDRDLWNQTAFE